MPSHRCWKKTPVTKSHGRIERVEAGIFHDPDRSGKLLVPALYRGIAYKRCHGYNLSVVTNRLPALLRMRLVLSVENMNGGEVRVGIFARSGLLLVINVNSQASTDL
jgi:hypothetical protein